jgi:Tfp pilus assembly protein PilP
VYQSRGRRDPFRPPRVKAAETLSIAHLKLTGIAREANSYYALVESDSSPGMGYIIREHDVVDSAKVVKITKDSVVFELRTKNPEGKLLARYIEKHMSPVVPR